jgi:hypothetical protein
MSHFPDRKTRIQPDNAVKGRLRSLDDLGIFTLTKEKGDVHGLHVVQKHDGIDYWIDYDNKSPLAGVDSLTLTVASIADPRIMYAAL